MTEKIFQKKYNFNISLDILKKFEILLFIFISVVVLTILQDFLESVSSGYSFYISESILFKTVWFLFIPTLTVLNIIIKKHNLNSFGKTAMFTITSIIIHLVLLPFVFLFFSTLFYSDRYDLYKIFTYTLANDLYKLVIIYSVFFFGHRFLSNKLNNSISVHEKPSFKKIIIANGINNTVIDVNDIYQITAETPYISIQLEEKKYLHSETLKSISTQLDNKTFVRVHKSTIVNLEKVQSFKSRLNGDYDLYLNNSDEIRLSRTYVANFKIKFKNV